MTIVDGVLSIWIMQIEIVNAWLTRALCRGNQDSEHHKNALCSG